MPELLKAVKFLQLIYLYNLDNDDVLLSVLPGEKITFSITARKNVYDLPDH